MCESKCRAVYCYLAETTFRVEIKLLLYMKIELLSDILPCK